MGIGVSSWSLARAVSSAGQLGVVSGTCIDTLFVRRLQDGDPGGHLRRAMEAFPLSQVAREALENYFVEGGKAVDASYRLLSMWRQKVDQAREQITMLASFAEVYLAKEGHDGPVGINLLTKVQMPNLPTLYGAMLAGVDYVLMGAGIPREIPGVLDGLAQHQPVVMRLDVEGPAGDEPDLLTFDPAAHWEDGVPEDLHRPAFLPIIASNSLARMLLKKATGRIDGWIVEGPTAGGHNAPPRGKLETNERGEPLYGERDAVDLCDLASMGLPFWLAGGTGSPEGMRAALDAGAAGIQVGTLFAYAEESGLEPELRTRVLEQAARDGGVEVFTDLRASPTGFPFKVVEIDGTNAQKDQYEARRRICDLGYLRTAYRMESGRVGYRCPAEPVKTFVSKGGGADEVVGRKCLCNALMADVGHPQMQKWGEAERPLLTSGDDLAQIGTFLQGRTRYSAEDVLEHLMQGAEASSSARAAVAG
jgi:NAD(P)H-dependent flavin oxidoreductase YrpB (nitropropane dioxygenase family)